MNIWSLNCISLLLVCNGHPFPEESIENSVVELENSEIMRDWTLHASLTTSGKDGLFKADELLSQQQSSDMDDTDEQQFYSFSSTEDENNPPTSDHLALLSSYACTSSQDQPILSKCDRKRPLNHLVIVYSIGPDEGSVLNNVPDSTSDEEFEISTPRRDPINILGTSTRVCILWLSLAILMSLFSMRMQGINGPCLGWHC